MVKSPFEKTLAEINAILLNQIFVYEKPNLVGNTYIGKKHIVKLGATKLNNIIRSIVSYASLSGFKLEKTTRKVTVIGSACDSISHTPLIAEAIESYDSHITAFATRTELDRDNDKIHVIPSKLMEIYADADEFIIIKSLVGNDTTVSQIISILKEKFPDKEISVFALFNTGNYSAEKLKIKTLFSLLEVDIKVYDITTEEGIEFLNNSGLVMNTQLGKGKAFIEEYGEGPYSIEQFKTA